MRIRSLAALPAVLAAALAVAPAAAQEAHGIVFAASLAEDGRAVLEPVANLARDGYLAPADDLEADYTDEFNARWLRPGTRYDVISRGERIGAVTVGAREVAACRGLTLRGALELRDPPLERWHGLAGAGIPEQAGAPWLREASPAERRELDRMAAALFQAHGIDAAARTEGETVTATLVVHRNARPLLVASYRTATGGALFRQAALFVVAEEGESGYRPAYAWFHEGRAPDVESRELLDAADLDGDGMPELVLRLGFYESWSYAILSRDDEGWTEAYRGGGGGC
jgi:hypothetical protein